ncbi:MAG: hypothetical protein AAFR37_25145, partial [Cyanobacteria bacterium J06628_3]
MQSTSVMMCGQLAGYFADRLRDKSRDGTLTGQRRGQAKHLFRILSRDIVPRRTGNTGHGGQALRRQYSSYSRDLGVGLFIIRLVNIFGSKDWRRTERNIFTNRMI